MPAKNEIVPLDAGPTRQTLSPPAPVPAKPAKGVRHEANGMALSAQERRIRLVAAQRRYTSFQLFYALFGLALMVVQMEYVWFANTEDFDGDCAVDAVTQCPQCLASLPRAVPVAEGRMMLHALRVLISFSTLILLYYIHAFFAAECEVLKIKNIVPPKATLLSSPLRNQLMFELLLFVIHPFPGLETLDPQWPNLVVASSLLMFPRFFLLFRLLQFRDSFNSSNGWFIGALTNVDFTAAFFLKSTLRNQPSRWIIASFMLLLGTTSYSLFVVERFLCAFHGDSCCAPVPFTDALWTLVITMLTIGYGDVVPKTAAGRFFAVLAGLFGTVFTAVTIAVMSTYLVLTRSEHKVNAFIKKDENRRLIQDHAARAIQAYVQLRAAQRRALGVKSKRATASVAKAEHKLYDVLRVYRQVKRYVNSHDVSDPMDKQMTMLEMMEVNVEYIRTKIEDLSDLFHSQVDKHNKSKRKFQAAATTTSAALALANAGASAAAIAAAQATSQAVAAAQAQKGATTTMTTCSVTVTSTDDGSFSAPPRTISETEPATAPSDPDAVVAAPTVCATASQSNIHCPSSVPGQPALFENEADPGTATALAATRRQNGAAPHIGVAAGVMSQGSKRNVSFIRPNETIVMGPQPHEAAAAGMPPEWAVVMEKTMQAILLQVTRVSDEMDSLRARVQTQMDQLQGRVGDIEKRLGVQDAFREISRGPSIRKGLLRTASGQLVDSGADVQSGIGPSVPLGGAARLGRMSFKHRPSIHNFVTTKDLEEFHNSGSND